MLRHLENVVKATVSKLVFSTESTARATGNLIQQMEVMTTTVTAVSRSVDQIAEEQHRRRNDAS